MATFLATLDGMVDECCQSQVPAEVPPGPQASLTRREVVTLCLGGQWACFPSERAFSRDAPRHRRAAVPTRPHRTPFNRLLRRHDQAIVACCLPLGDRLRGRHGRSEVLESSAVPTRAAPRRGAGWLPGLADLGWSHRRGRSEGCPRLMAGNPRGVITGCGVGPASAKAPPLAGTVFALRRPSHPGCRSGGQPALGPSRSDQGVEGQAAPARWWDCEGAQVLCPPKRHSRQPWPKRGRRGRAGVRQIVETVDDKVHHTFALSRERPHALTGFQARVAAKMARHHCCIWRNEPLGRPSLALADLVEW